MPKARKTLGTALQRTRLKRELPSMLCPTRGRVYIPIEVLKVQSWNGLYISVNAKLNYTSYVVFLLA